MIPPPISRTSVFSGEFSAWVTEETSNAASDSAGTNLVDLIIRDLRFRGELVKKSSETLKYCYFVVNMKIVKKLKDRVLQLI
ncbi:hypothetical protein PAFU01_44130 (plasmid) [Pantoea ananatis]|nr:hypothetical protein PAFU01_44130 [Pantoea ananatis]